MWIPMKAGHSLELLKHHMKVMNFSELEVGLIDLLDVLHTVLFSMALCLNVLSVFVQRNSAYPSLRQMAAVRKRVRRHLCL
jgi:hypothetical protein